MENKTHIDGTVPKSIENFSKFVARKKNKTKNIEAEAKSTAYFHCDGYQDSNIYSCSLLPRVVDSGCKVIIRKV